LIDPFLEKLKPMAKLSGHRIVRFEECDGSKEFPAGTSAAYITGPSIAPAGLPFCVPTKDRQLWADRIVVMLAASYYEGAKIGMAPDLESLRTRGTKESSGNERR
jgi:hypothetical protein